MRISDWSSDVCSSDLNMLIPTLAKRDGAFRLNAWSRVDGQGEVTDKAEHLLEDVGLVEKKDVKADYLSRGDKCRLELAMCLVQDPKLLLLDEPTAGMSRADTNDTIDLLQRIGERGITKIVIEHDMHVVFSLAQRRSEETTSELQSLMRISYAVFCLKKKKQHH